MEVSFSIVHGRQQLTPLFKSARTSIKKSGGSSEQAVPYRTRGGTYYSVVSTP
jgi:hypothetical protein